MKKVMLFVCVLAAASVASAQQVYYVASYGSDANPCSTVAPCRTITRAAALMTGIATAGTILALDSAEYTFGASLAFHNPVTIDGGDHGAFITGPEGGSAISAQPGGICTFRNLTVITGNSAGSEAFNFDIAVGGARLDHVTIHSFPGNTAIGIAGKVPADFALSLNHVTILGTSQGVVMQNLPRNPTSPFTVTMNEVTIRAASIGVQINEGSLTIRDSVIGDATNDGVVLISPQTSPVSYIEHTEFVNNFNGLAFGGGTARISNSTFTGNTNGILSFGGTLISFRNNVFAGNGTDGAPTLTTSFK